MITWQYDFGLCPEENVEKDHRLFYGTDDFGTPVLARVHTFDTYCATTGYLSRLSKKTGEKFEEMAVPLLRRASGGGIAFHGEDLCFSFFFDTGAYINATYRYASTVIRRIVTDVLRKGTGLSLGSPKISSAERPESEYCLNREDESDIFLGRQKIAGFGGRVRKNVFLVHMQVISAGWNPDMIVEFEGKAVTINHDYLCLKKFVFSRDFLENIKKEIECAFSRQGREDRVCFA